MRQSKLTEIAITEIVHKFHFEASKIRSKAQLIKYCDDVLDQVVQLRNRTSEQIDEARARRAHNRARAAKKAMLANEPAE